MSSNYPPLYPQGPDGQPMNPDPTLTTPTQHQSQPTWQQASPYASPNPGNPYGSYPSYPSSYPQPQPQAASGPKSWLNWFGAQSSATKAIIAGAAVLIVLILSCCGCGSFLAVIGQGNGGANLAQPSSTSTSAPTQAQPTQTQQAQPTATPKPKATANPNASASAYKSMIAQDAATLQTDAEAAGNSCSNGSIADCKDSMQQFDTDDQQFQADLDAHPAPPCLSQVDGYLRNALKLYDEGAQDVIDGINSFDSGKVSQGTSLIKSGTTSLDKATSAEKTATC